MLRGLLGLITTSLLFTSLSAKEDHIAKFVKSLTAEEKEIINDMDTIIGLSSEKMESIKEESASLHQKITNYNLKLSEIKASLSRDEDMDNGASGFFHRSRNSLFILDEKDISDTKGREILFIAELFKKLSAFAQGRFKEECPSTHKLYDEKGAVVKSLLMKRTEYLFELQPGWGEFYQELDKLDREAEMVRDDPKDDNRRKLSYATKYINKRTEINKTLETFTADSKKFMGRYDEIVKRHKFQESSTAELEKSAEEARWGYNVGLNVPERAAFKAAFPRFDIVLTTEGRLQHLLTFISYPKGTIFD